MRRLLKDLLTLAVSCLLALGLAEAALRVYGAVNKKFPLAGLDPMAVQIEPHGRFGYRQKPNAIFHYANGTVATTNASGYRGPVVSPTPAPGVTRIVLLGGSSSYGWYVPDDQTIDVHLRTLLAQRFPERKFEVVNLGFDGYDSYQDLQRLESDALALHPSIVIVNSGPNDVRNAWYPKLHDADERTLIWEPVLARLRAERERGGPTAWTRVKHYLVLARLPGWLREQMSTRRLVQERAARSAAQQRGAAAGDTTTAASHEGPPYPDAADYFERNVRKTVELSLGVGASVLLSTPPSALPSMPPDTTSTQSYWLRDARTTQAYRDTLAARMERIAAQESAAHHPVRYVAAQLPRSLFLDDAHLTGEGYAAVARAFMEALTPFLGASAAPRAERAAP